jgi:hypothetical protein
MKHMFIYRGPEAHWFGPGARYEGIPGKFLGIFEEDMKHEHIVSYIDRGWLVPSQEAKEAIEVTDEVPPVEDSVEVEVEQASEPEAPSEPEPELEKTSEPEPDGPEEAEEEEEEEEEEGPQESLEEEVEEETDPEVYAPDDEDYDKE